MAIWIHFGPFGLGGNMDCEEKNMPDMIAPYWPSRYPVMVTAHRGFSGAAPENTWLAFQKAIEIGADMLELDVRFSRDREIVVIHDETVDRTTNGRGKVFDYSLKDLRRLNAGSSFSPQSAPENIPILKEILELAKGKIPVNIEIKNPNESGYSILDLTDRTLEEVKKAGMLSQVIFSCFNPQALERIKEVEPRVWMALLYHEDWKSVRDVTQEKDYRILNLRHIYVTENKIKQIHKAGMKVNVYTVNAEEEMKQFIRWDVDGIITNHPDKLIRILQMG